MLIKTLKWLAVLFLTFVVIVIAYARVTGLVLLSSREGKMTGYHFTTQQWYFHEMPNYAAERDGPYVFHHDQQRHALLMSPTKHNQFELKRTTIADSVQVVVDNDAQTQFDVRLRPHHPRSQLRYPQPEKWLALSDLEGEFDNAVKLLHANGVVDQYLHWSYGNGELILLGDMVDRGRNVVPLLWLIYRLEGEAELAGGRVHYILGNHEYYLLQGNVNSAAKKYLATIRASQLSPKSLWSENTELGRWLRSKPVLLQIGDTLFMHGGISDEVLKTNINLKQADQLAAKYFGHDPHLITDNSAEIVLTGSRSILWYRGMATSIEKTPKVDSQQIDRVLKQFEVKRIAIGHTLTAHVGSDFDGRVLRTDVPHADGTNEGILFMAEQLYAVDHEGKQQVLTSYVELTE